MQKDVIEKTGEIASRVRSIVENTSQILDEQFRRKTGLTTRDVMFLATGLQTAK